MSEDEVKNKKLDLLMKIVRKIVDDLQNLESEEKAEKKKKKGQGLKIMTPKQMITRLPILLAQLKAGNNSQKFKKLNKTNCLLIIQIKKLKQNSL